MTRKKAIGRTAKAKGKDGKTKRKTSKIMPSNTTVKAPSNPKNGGKPAASIGNSTRATKSEVADLFGVTIQTVSNWVRRGCPYLKKGDKHTPWDFDLLEVNEWLERYRKAPIEKPGQRKGDLEAAQLRLTEAKAAKAEQELEVLEGSLLEREQVVKTWTKVFSSIRARLLALPSRLTPIIFGKTASEIQPILEREIHDVLSELSTPEFTRGALRVSSPGGDEDLLPSSEVDGQ